MNDKGGRRQKKEILAQSSIQSPSKWKIPTIPSGVSITSRYTETKLYLSVGHCGGGGGQAGRAWLRHYDTSRKVAGSIPDKTTACLCLPNHSNRTTDLGPPRPQTEMSTGDILGKVKGGRPERLT
jgi:hypothetical protein